MKKLSNKPLYVGTLKSGKTTYNALKMAKTFFKYKLGIKWYFLSKKAKNKLYKTYYEALLCM